MVRAERDLGAADWVTMKRRKNVSELDRKRGYAEEVVRPLASVLNQARQIFSGDEGKLAARRVWSWPTATLCRSAMSIVFGGAGELDSHRD